MLMEILMAWALTLSFLLKLQLFQMHQGQFIKLAYYRSMATIQLQSLAEQLRVEPIAKISLQELNTWNKQNIELLPKGFGTYVCETKKVNLHDCELKIHWAHPQRYSLSLSLII
jgi:Tfp pilus assembly protein PilV